MDGWVGGSKSQVKDCLQQSISERLIFAQKGLIFTQKVDCSGWMGGWMGVKARLRIAYSNQ